MIIFRYLSYGYHGSVRNRVVIINLLSAYYAYINHDGILGVL